MTTEQQDTTVEEHPTFAELGVHADIVEALKLNGITHAFPIQAMTLPVAVTGQDIIGQAKTGTGKTLGFGIPLLQQVYARTDVEYKSLTRAGAPQALVVVPTRELAVQVADDLQKAATKRGIRVTTIYGGRAYEPQIAELNNGTDLVVGTPGRLIDLFRQRHLSLDAVRAVVLDEADEMLDLGFLPDVETLMAALPTVRQTMLFSATMPGPVMTLARRFMSRPMHIRAADPEDDGATKKDIRQVIYRAHQLDKNEVVARILQANGRGRTIIFTKTKRSAAQLSDELSKRGFAAGAIHGDLGQGAREQALRAFRNNKIDVLVATDVAARGIDVEDVTHVINFQCPEDEKVYLHRIGRTGRAGQKGTAITFVDWDDVHRWQLIDRALDLGIPEPRETYSSSEHLYTDLDIPEGTKGRLPRHQRTKPGLEAEEREELDRRDRSDQPRGRGSRNRGRSRSRGSDSQESGQPRQRRERQRTRTKRVTADGQQSTTSNEQVQRNDAEQGSQQPKRRRTRTRRRTGGTGRGNSSAEGQGND